MKARLFLPLFIIFLTDSILIPVVFVGALLLFFIHALLLMLLRCTLRFRWHRLAVAALLAFQMGLCRSICDVSSGISCLTAAVFHLPVWLGYLVMRLPATADMPPRQR